MNFDIETLTLNEVEILEDLTGGSIDSMLEEGSPRGKTLKALAFIIMKRDNPDVTLEEAGNTQLSVVMESFSEDEDAEGND